MNSTGQTLTSHARSLFGAPALFFLLWAGWLASPYLVFGQGSYCRSHDNADSFLALALANSVGASGMGDGGTR
jgi:hypothetical protein